MTSKRHVNRTPEGVTDTSPIVPVVQWGRDHWTTLLYFESRCVDHAGRIGNQHMRTNARLHRKLLGGAQWDARMSGEGYPTRLRDGATLDHHDDWSCAEDLVGHGLIEVVQERDRKPAHPFSGGEVFVQLTNLGWRVVQQIRRDRAEGKPIVMWSPRPELEAEITAARALQKCESADAGA
jgi:hypothetical protein